MIELRAVRKVYHQASREVVALDGVDLHVRQGEIFGVLGQSGAGKSTLIRCVNLLERPTSGTVHVAGKELTALSAAELRRARQQIGMIFQHFNLLSSRTVAENVALPLEITGRDRSSREARVRELLGLVGLGDKAEAYPSQLSGGQKQRVGIARALAAEPKVLLSDEATSALDPQTTQSILDLLKDLNRRLGVTILLITHELNVVKHICDSIAVMSMGRIIERGPVVEALTRLGELTPLDRQRADGTPGLRPNTALVTITFSGGVADQPVITTMARTFDLDVNILRGNIETIGQSRVGQLQLELAGDEQKLSAAIRYLYDQGLRLEVVS